MTSQTTTNFDVAVVGGGAAGLSAAVTLGRARRTAVVIDDGRQRNRPADGIHGFLTRDGMSPADFVAAGRDEVRRYGGTFRSATAVSARREGERFTVILDDGGSITARRLIVTTGLVDELPEIPGLREQWGHGVIHCPYCHGWEVRDEPIGIIATSALSVHQTLLFRQWTADLVYFAHTAPELSEDDRARFTARGIRIVEGELAEVVATDGQVVGVRLTDGTVVPRRALVAGAPMVARSELLQGLGLEPTPHPMGAFAGSMVDADPTGRTAVPGVWVAGNVRDLSAQVVTSAAQGVMAGAMVNFDLVEEETAAALAAAGVSAG